MKKIRIGAVNWDASLPSEYYFGFYQTSSLSQAKYRTWTPFYADIIDKERVGYHIRTVEEYEKEMQYAIDAGVDYFAFVWYPTEGSKEHKQGSARDCSHKVFELNYARGLYQKSTLKEKLGACAILGAHPFTDNDIIELVRAFAEPYYEKIDGMPLLYLYGGYREEIVEKIFRACEERGIPTPFIVPMVTNAEGVEKMPRAAALSAYTSGADGINTYDELIDISIEKNAARISGNIGFIPTFNVGWDPSPRIDRPVPWMSTADGKSAYPALGYAKMATGEELCRGAVKFAKFLLEKAKNNMVGHVLTFAWNEFEEGGFFCPTYTEKGEIDATRVEFFAKISRLFKETLA